MGECRICKNTLISKKAILTDGICCNCSRRALSLGENILLSGGLEKILADERYKVLVELAEFAKIEVKRG